MKHPAGACVGVLADRPAELLTALTIAYINFVSEFPQWFQVFIAPLTDLRREWQTQTREIVLQAHSRESGKQAVIS